ncbi:CKLF-like MARVEL transmembrane domain-containing protein 3 isoform X2 [Chrysemys picta bellii]|uniref:CKLF-like MARVEL transmembrane domain-containing protein 3 isoform X2 n=1 Tax=Chrysemys picta bellii TaxID=8478 RepID=UPI0032B11A29
MLWHQDTLAFNSVRRNNYICFLFILDIGICGVGPKISWVQMFPALSCHGASKSGFNVIGATTLFYLALPAWEEGRIAGSRCWREVFAPGCIRKWKFGGAETVQRGGAGVQTLAACQPSAQKAAPCSRPGRGRRRSGRALPRFADVKSFFSHFRSVTISVSLLTKKKKIQVPRRSAAARAAQASPAPLPAMDLPASEDPDAQAPPPGLRTLLPSREFLCSRKGQLLLAESVLSFITFICYIASSAASFMMAPLIEFLLALFLFFAYSSKLNEKFKGIYWPLSVFGFIATIVFAVDFYITFNDLVTFLKQGGSENATEAQKSEDEASDSDSD